MTSVHRLLDSSGEARIHLTPPGRPAWRRTRAIDLPSKIGAFRLLEVLGRGGMGTVYLAQQTGPIRRRVALKRVNSDHLDAETIERFYHERQALARMSHPNIAQVFEAGSTEDGSPYVVMELVQGVPLTEYCDLHQLPIPDRLALFLTVCRGVQHAHQKSIVHRDLKPSNILVTEVEGRPHPKIIDFGIAKRLDPSQDWSDHVDHDRMLGTPAYLSPEAIRLDGKAIDIDTRTDVYALGVLLYEILTGVVPFVRGPDEPLVKLFQRIVEEPPRPPSICVKNLPEVRRKLIPRRRKTSTAALRKDLTGDLNWIVQKALAKAPDERYPSANALAADVERHLQHEPVSAAPSRLGYRLLKLIRRRRTTLLVGILLVVALLAAHMARTIESQRAQHTNLTIKQVAANLENFAIRLEKEGRHADAARIHDEVRALRREVFVDEKTAQRATD